MRVGDPVFSTPASQKGGASMGTADQGFERVMLARLDRLEARNRQLTLALVAVSVVLVGLAAVNGLLTWAAWTRPTVDAEEFVVRGPDGRPRARLTHRDSGTGIQSTSLTFLDADGRARVRLSDGDLCSLQLMSGDGQGYVALNAGKNQCDLAMYMEKETHTANLFLNSHRDWARVALDSGRGQTWRQEVGGVAAPK
jgi:hypothetical protein